MRRLLLALGILLICATAATGVKLHASTECERWIAEYLKTLEHSPAVQHANAARHRLHRYVHRKVVALSKPKPTPKAHALPVRYMRPKMSREETLRRMELACGEIALDQPSLGALPLDPVPTFLAENGAEDTLPLGLLPSGPISTLVSENNPVAGGGFPILGVPGLPLIPGGGGGGTSTPDTPPTGGTGGTGGGGTVPPTAETPEPGSLVLLATGLLGAAGAIRRRIQA